MMSEHNDKKKRGVFSTAGKTLVLPFTSSYKSVRGSGSGSVTRVTGAYKSLFDYLGRVFRGETRSVSNINEMSTDELAALASLKPIFAWWFAIIGISSYSVAFGATGFNALGVLVSLVALVFLRRLYQDRRKALKVLKSRQGAESKR